MPRSNPFDATRLRLFRLTWWQSALIVALVVAVVAAVALVATSLVLILTPIVLIAALAHRFLGARGPRRDDAPRGSQPQVIDAEYQIVESEPSADRDAADRHPDSR
jgi:hypothetical protein